MFSMLQFRRRFRHSGRFFRSQYQHIATEARINENAEMDVYWEYWYVANEP